MTAPDPGLTDLIAAEIAMHQLDFGAMWHDDIRACTCGERVEEGYHSPHVASRVALVAMQHANGRIAELEERIANAQSLCHDTGRYNAARQKYWNIRVFACDVLAALKGRAALEGEQQ